MFPEEPADALVRIQRLIRRRPRGGLPGSRLRGAEVELLRLVEARPGIGVSAAARRLHLAGNSVSALVNRLLRDGHLLRETDPADRRAARLLLTAAAGKRHLAGNSVSALVNRLLRDGHLLRETDPADRRAARLLLTAAAGKRLGDWRRRRAELAGRHVSRLDDADHGALRAALPALRKPAATLHEEAEES
ncbi:MarR family transcriptional regulator [Streptomyces sp. CB01883]|uniref:MarR family transcriptional regulator n=1 Tax=Streptomyces sp. CB01883 TaxID=1703943 RepID=UPI00093C271B|nr:helix-turn-helix domain-containing protein [Streptomyces sp. CB01883]OKJ81547.1 MarR family transcriptional regulator [Streptomyces sp. CB01883]